MATMYLCALYKNKMVKNMKKIVRLIDNMLKDMQSREIISDYKICSGNDISIIIQKSPSIEKIDIQISIQNE